MDINELFDGSFKEWFNKWFDKNFPDIIEIDKNDFTDKFILWFKEKCFIFFDLPLEMVRKDGLFLRFMNELDHLDDAFNNDFRYMYLEENYPTWVLCHSEGFVDEFSCSWFDKWLMELYIN